ncbi:MAG: error-prone DNA polymerase [Candidatus Nanopelagicales bacterium]
MTSHQRSASTANHYAELHAHSYFSFLDGVCSPAEMVAEATRLELSGLALLDHDGFYGVVQFAQAAREVGLPTVFGAELTLGATKRPNGLTDPEGQHLVVLARGPSGYARLSSAISHANLGGQKGQPKLALADLADAHNGEWLVLTGCRKGLVPSALAQGGVGKAEQALGELIDMFGKANVAVELWHHHDPYDDQRNDVLYGLASRHGLAAVATTNAHYATPERSRLAHATAAIRARRDLARMDGWLPASPTAHLRSPAEQHRRFRRYPGVVAQAAQFAADLAFDLSLVAPALPDFPVPEGHTEASYLRWLTEQGAQRLYGPRDRERVPGAWKQLDYELTIIEQLNFPGYFLIVWDIVTFARNSNILCQGRGSAANSAVCYALGITNCDPVGLGLLFERFLSPARDGPPDIDVDFESGRREEVIQYVYTRHGRYHAAQVANVNTYRPRSAIRDAARGLGYEQGSADAWTKNLEYWGRGSATVDADSSIPKPVLDLAEQLLDFPRHLSVHSGGMVICDRPVTEVCPVEWATAPGRTVLQWDKEDCAAVGLVKFDLLGLGMLEAIHRAIDLVAQFHDVHVDLARLPQEDAVYDRLCEADTVGVFQIESRAQMATLPRLRPRNFYDLVVEVALIRPGPIQGGSVHPYLRRRSGKEPITYLHPSLEPSLRKTLGVPIFQEQLMQMAIDVAGFTAAEADQLRQAMGSKRSAAKMEALRERLYSGMAERGIIGEAADQVFTSLAAFASFGFPESHAASFAYLVYSSSWLKLHYPAAFLASLLNSQPMGFWSPATLVADARRHGVTVLRADVNFSDALATLERAPDSNASQDSAVVKPNAEAKPDAAVRLGLTSIKGVGTEAAERIASARPFSNLDDLARRTELSKKQLEALASAGATASLDHGERRTSLWSAGTVAHQSQDQLPGLIFGDTAPKLARMSPDETLIADLQTTGISVDSSPMQLLKHRLRGYPIVPANELVNHRHGSRVSVAGIITHRQRPETAAGVTFLNLEDESGLINVVCSLVLWQQYRDIARNSTALLVRGYVESADGAINVVAKELEDLKITVAPPSRDFH